MMMMEAKRQAYWWWFDSHNSPKYSPWLRSTLSELEDKTKAMLKLIEEDADSFAQRAEMYYKKRPELISMVEDFYRAYRSLAERYDQQKMDPLTRVKSPLRHSMPDLKTELGLKSFPGFPDESYNSSSEESAESEVDDLEIDYEDHDMVVVGDENEDEDELMKMRRELEKLQEESEIQRSVIKQSVKEAEELRNFMERMKLENVKLKEEMKKKEKERSEMLRGLEKAKYELMITREEMQAQARDQQEALAQKDEEKREVIRQLSLSMEMLREEKRLLKKSIMIRDVPKKQNTPDFQIFKGFGLGNLFGLSPKSMSIVPL